MKKQEIFEMKVEIPTGSSNKYEFDQFSQQWKLDRVLYGSMFYPAEYGYIEETIDYDGDPLDVLCITSNPTFQGCLISIKIIGVLEMIDQNQEDYKIIAVPSSCVDPRFSHINSIDDIGHKAKEIIDFFLNYKNLEDKKVLVKGFLGFSDAVEVIEDCKKMFLEVKKNFSFSSWSKEEVVEFLKNYKERKNSNKN